MSDLTVFHTVLNAIAFAARAHDGQLRKDGHTPYVSHVFRVAAIVRNLFGFDDPRMLATAILHDTIEDTKTDFDELEENFGREIADWVGLLSKDKRLPEEERERRYLDGLKAAPWQVKVCKLADVYDNLLDSENLPDEKRGQSVEKARNYLKALEGSKAAELKKPLELVKGLLDNATHSKVNFAG